MTTKRGRKSVASLAVVQGDFAKGRPPPPRELTDRQCEFWREITESEPVDFFSTAATRGMLADLCRHRESGEQLSTLIGSFAMDCVKTEEGAERYAALLRMRDRETRAAASLATKLRLTNQSRYAARGAARTAANAATGTRPWDG